MAGVTADPIYTLKRNFGSVTYCDELTFFHIKMARSRVKPHFFKIQTCRLLVVREIVQELSAGMGIASAHEQQLSSSAAGLTPQGSGSDA